MPGPTVPTRPLHPPQSAHLLPLNMIPTPLSGSWYHMAVLFAACAFSQLLLSHQRSAVRICTVATTSFTTCDSRTNNNDSSLVFQRMLILVTRHPFPSRTTHMTSTDEEESRYTICVAPRSCPEYESRAAFAPNRCTRAVFMGTTECKQLQASLNDIKHKNASRKCHSSQ